jgi:cation-transporting ATPase E
MTGDGVNDVLALKEADCSVAMASGTDAAKNVSQLVLLDSNFASMPHIVDEGRRSVNNLERSATLFLVKTIYATVLAFVFLFINRTYPFIPIQLTLTSTLAIGTPSVILALEANHNRIKGNFIINVMKKSLPPAISIIIGVLIIALCSSIFRFSTIECSSLTALVTTFICFTLLFKVCRPFNNTHKILFVTMVSLYILLFIVLKSFFDFSSISILMMIILVLCIIVCLVIYKYVEENIEKVMNKLLKVDVS